MQLKCNDGLLSFIHSQAVPRDIQIILDTGQLIALPNVAAETITLIGEITPPDAVITLTPELVLKAHNETEKTFRLTLKSGSGSIEAAFDIFPGGRLIASIEMH